MSRLLKTTILLFAILSLILPSRCSAKPYTEKKPSLSPFTTIIKTLSIIRPTIVINVDDLKKSSSEKTNGNQFFQYLKLFPTIEQGRINGLRIVLLSKINQWKLFLNDITLTVNSSQSGKNDLWHLTGVYELQHPVLKTSGTISMELVLAAMKNKFNGRGKLKIAGKTPDHHYTLSMPISINENLLLKPELSLDDHPCAVSELHVKLPSSAHPSWKVACRGELTNLMAIAAGLQADNPSIAKIFSESRQFHYQLLFAGKREFLQAPYDVSLQLNAEKIQFQSADAEVAIEDTGISLDAGMSVPENGPGHLKITTRFHGGPFLWHNYFWDLTDQDAEGTLEAIMPFNHGFPALDSDISFSGRIDADPLWTGVLNGSWSPGKGTLSFTGQSMDIAGTVKIFMPEFLQKQPGILKELKAEGSYQLSATMNMEGHKITVIAGNISLNNGNISSKNYGQLHNLEISIPLTGLSWNIKTAKLQVSNQKTVPMLKFGSISGPYLFAEDQIIPVDWVGDSLSIPTMLKVVVLGCPLMISNITLHHPLSATSRQAKLQFEIKPAPSGSQLTELPFSEKVIDLINEIRLHLQAGFSLHLDGNQLNVRGEVRFPLFSGQVSIDNIQVRRLFSASRVIALDMEAEKLDLQKVTALVQAGSATGIIDMKLKDLEISYGQPSKFDLEIKSVKTSGVPRKISVEAIENLSLLSSGSGGGQGLLNVGLNRFFSHYRYDKIGLYCRLRDDVFQLRGLVHEGGREYVVKRGFLTGVDVVNYNPDNRISFRDMQERVLRIFNNK